MTEYVYKPDPLFRREYIALPHIAKQRKDMADSWRAARKKSPAITRLAWKRYGKAANEMMDAMFAHGTTAEWMDRE